LLGLPKEYQTIEYHEANLKGRININRYIREDMPYKGMLSSTSREQVEVSEIVDVLYCAAKILSKEHTSLVKRIKHITQHLKQAGSLNPVSRKTILRAKQAKSLQNPIFLSYKRVLKFAEMIIRSNGLQDNVTGRSNGNGFLIDVAELFEIYTSKLLVINFPEWHVSSPKIPVYEDTFYNRKIIPDIVMLKDDNAMVFDAKYKRMNFNGRTKSGMGDVDRNDFFQIHTYMSYYRTTHNVLVAGLLYPLSTKYDKQKCFSNASIVDNKTKFLVDGIELDKITQKDILTSENNFISRIKSYLYYESGT